MDKIDRMKMLVRHTILAGIASNQKELGKLLGYSNASSFSQIITGYKAMPKDLLVRWRELLPSLNIHWIETGDGTMLTDGAATVGDRKSVV